MRDNHEGLPEIINAYERDGHFFCSIALTIGTETKAFEFGINQDSYHAVKRMLGLRPFEQFPGAKYRYFFTPSGWRKEKGSSKTYCFIRIEQERKGKNFEVAAPEPLIANLLWFFEVKDFCELIYLREIIREDYLQNFGKNNA